MSLASSPDPAACAALAAPALRVDGVAAAACFVELLRQLAHAVRGPVAAMQTAAELLRGPEPSSPEDLALLLEVFANESARAALLLERLQGLHGLGALRPVELEAAALAREAATRARREGAREVRVEVAPEAAALRVLVDPTALGAALDALVRNALEALASDDEAAGAGRGAAREVALRVERDDARGAAVLRVRDDGPGLSEGAARNAFRLFFSTRAGAAGLGLPLARMTAVAHGGSLTLAPRSPRGVEAVLVLPALAARDVDPSEPSAAER